MIAGTASRSPMQVREAAIYLVRHATTLRDNLLVPGNSQVQCFWNKSCHNLKPIQTRSCRAVNRSAEQCHWSSAPGIASLRWGANDGDLDFVGVSATSQASARLKIRHPRFEGLTSAARANIANAPRSVQRSGNLNTSIGVSVAINVINVPCSIGD